MRRACVCYKEKKLKFDASTPEAHASGYLCPHRCVCLLLMELGVKHTTFACPPAWKPSWAIPVRVISLEIIIISSSSLYLQWNSQRPHVGRLLLPAAL